MLKKAILTRMISVTIFATLGIQASFSQTTFYVDPAFNGTRTGSASKPWQSLSDNVSPSPWSAINAALASGPVTVYFSATGSSTAQIGYGARTDKSSNVLTLDGISQKNTNSASPSWTTNVTLSPCNYEAANCAWATAAKFTITANTPFTGSDDRANCVGNFVFQGFTVHNTEGQSADLTYTHDLVFQYNDVSRVATGSYGPGIIVGPGQHGPCQNGTTFSGPDNVTIQYNYVHATWGECIYVGASTSDPPGYGGTDGEYTSSGLTCKNNCPTGANYLIQGNVIESCASWGGQGDGTDVKDGHVNLQVLSNIYRTSKPCTNCGNNTCTADGVPGPGCDGQGPLFESGAVVANNYIESPGHQCIPVYSSWNNAAGRGTMTVENNICVNANSGAGSNTAYHWWPPTIVQGVTPPAWNQVNFFNNTAYNSGLINGDPCIQIDTGGSGNGTNPSNSSIVENNITSTCGGPGLLAAPGIVSVHDYNDFYATASCGSEAHGICTNPQFVATGTPYADVNFALQAGSPAAGAGVNLASVFTTDYFGNNRTVPWDMGAIGGSSSGGAPNPPTSLVVTVN